MILCLKFARKVPGAIVVCFGATAAVAALHLNVETIGSRFGGIPSGLPHITVPALHYDTMRQLFSAAFTVAMLGAIEVAHVRCRFRQNVRRQAQSQRRANGARRRQYFLATVRGAACDRPSLAQQRTSVPARKRPSRA